MKVVLKAFTDEQLTKVLEASNRRHRVASQKIPVTSETLTILRDGLSVLTLQFTLETGTDRLAITLRDDLVELCESLRIVGKKIEGEEVGLATAMFVVAKLEGSNLSTVMSEAARNDSKLWVYHQYLIEHHRVLLAAAEHASKTFSEKVRLGRPRSPDTGFLHLTRILYGKLTGTRDPAIGEPLHLFTKACAELIGEAGMVPENFPTFRGRFRGKRSGKRSGKRRTLIPHKKD